jgi:class 3 adenylate cyclase/ABC-type transport system involved in cytochrome c biogenesis ATPase subunit
MQATAPPQELLMSDLKLWLESLGLEKYKEVLENHDVDLSVVSDLTEQDLEKLGLSLGHRRKFIAAAKQLVTTPSPPPSQLPQAGQAPTVERRQVTIVFVDLVGSTELGSGLDPEDLVALLRRYREACVATIAKHDGFIAQYLGDGILVYFGFPQAQEDAAERAVRAGLEIVERVGKLAQPDGLPLQSRVGILTGLVVVGEAAGVGVAGEETVVGDTPNLAARLQTLAAPDSVLVGPSTHRLTADFFEYSFFGNHAIKGFPDPIPVWQAVRESPTESRFAAAHAAAAGPIVGRERELSFLHDAWQRATQGNGHVVLLEGEPGIGKSRLVEALAECLREAPHRLLRGQCSPYHRNSALFPFRRLLRHSLKIDSNLSTSENLNRISRMLERVGRSDRVSTLLLAELLEVVPEDKLSPTEMTPNQRRGATLAILEDLLVAQLSGPVLLVLEDAHWSDQTTQTLMERLLRRVERERALVVITYRPELKIGWPRHPNATLIVCKQIGHAQCVSLIRNVANQMQMDTSLIEEIVARSDGVPLFVEELTRAVLDLRAAGPSTVPLTLRDSLMARLDRLGDAKEIAQIASVLGRQFSYTALAAIANANENDLRAALSRLRESSLIFEAWRGEDSAFSFNHSLVQEAAYESLPRSRRQSLHGKVARYFEARSAAGDREPTLIAYHYGRSGEAQKSFQFWLIAADQSGERLALAECVANLGAALAEAERVTDLEARKRLKLEAQLKLGATLAIQKGPQSDEAGSALEKAEALAREVNAGQQLFQAPWGLYLNAARNRCYDKAEVFGGELMRISQELDDDDLKYEALHHNWGLAYFTGQTPKMLELAAEGIANYDRHRHHRFSYVYAGHDPGVCAYCVRAQGLGVAGLAKGVRSTLDAGLALATSLQHPLTLAFFHSVACFAMHLAQDPDGCLEFAEQLVHISTRYDLPTTRAVGLFMSAAAWAHKGDVTAALRQMEPSFEATLGYGFMGVYPGIIMVETLAGAARNQEASALTERLLDDLTTPETGVFVPELWRLRGELVLREAANNTSLAERYLKTAQRIAQAQSAPIYHLRAAIALARLLAERGQLEQARSALRAPNAPAEWPGPENAIAARLRSELK